MVGGGGLARAFKGELASAMGGGIAPEGADTSG